MISLIEYIQSGGSRATYRQTRSKQEEMEIAKLSTLYFRYKRSGWTLEPSIHSAAQSYDRRPDFEQSDWSRLHKKVIDALINMQQKRSGDYLFYSKSMNQAYIVSVDFARSFVRIITVLPRGRSNPKPGTQKIIVENKEIELLDIIELD